MLELLEMLRVWNKGILISLVKQKQFNMWINFSSHIINEVQSFEIPLLIYLLQNLLFFLLEGNGEIQQKIIGNNFLISIFNYHQI